MEDRTNLVKSSVTYTSNEAGLLFQALFNGYFDSLGDDLREPEAYMAVARQKQDLPLAA